MYVPHTVWIKHPYDSAALENLSFKERVLHFIVNCGPVSYSHIVARTGIRKSVVSPILRKLEANNLVNIEVRPTAYQNRKFKFYSGIYEENIRTGS